MTTGYRKTERRSSRLQSLTAAAVKHAGPGKHYDAHGLFLLVEPSGARRWVQRIVIRGRRRDLGLGAYPLVSLAEARQQAFDNRKLARAGGDPLALRKPAVPTFAEAVDEVIKVHEPTWKDGARSAEIWRSSLGAYAMPRLGRLPVSDVTTADVMAVLLPIWNEKRETARRVRQRIGAVMKWAVAQGFRQDNPAGDAIGAALPKSNGVQRHMRALHHADVAGALAKVRASGAAPTTKLAFEFLVLTAARSGEVRLATWDEIDQGAALWTVPANRMKTLRKHRVPLSGRAVEVLEAARDYADESGLVFPSVTGRPMSDMTLSKLVKEQGIAAVPHGFRSSFRDWCSDTGHPREVAEAALAHVVRGVEPRREAEAVSRGMNWIVNWAERGLFDMQALRGGDVEIRVKGLEVHAPDRRCPLHDLVESDSREDRGEGRERGGVMTAVAPRVATAILRRPDVERLTQLSKATIYRLVKSGEFRLRSGSACERSRGGPVTSRHGWRVVPRSATTVAPASGVWTNDPDQGPGAGIEADRGIRPGALPDARDRHASQVAGRGARWADDRVRDRQGREAHPGALPRPARQSERADGRRMSNVATLQPAPAPAELHHLAFAEAFARAHADDRRHWATRGRWMAWSTGEGWREATGSRWRRPVTLPMKSRPRGSTS